MLHELLRGAMCCAMAATLSQTASAANGELFQFTETSSTPSGMVIARGELVLSKAAFSAGVSIRREWIDGGGDNNLAGVGIMAMDFQAGGIDQWFGGDRLYKDFCAYPLDIFGPGFYWNVSLTSSPNGTPTGGISFNDGFSDFNFILAGSTSSGDAATDQPSVCDVGGACQFTGIWQDMGKAVPEPSGLLVLGPLALGLGLVRAGRRSADTSTRGAR